jgi:transposase
MTRNESIVAMVKDGNTYADAAEHFGVSRSVVAGVCNRAGLRTGFRKTKKFSDSRRKSLAEVRSRAKADPALKARWIASIKDGLKRYHESRA